MAENKHNPMESFKEKLEEAIKGDNKAEGIKAAIMDLLKAHGAAIPNIDSIKMTTGTTVKDNDAIVGSFTKKVNEAIKGEHQAQDVIKAVNGMLKAYDIPVLKSRT